MQDSEVGSVLAPNVRQETTYVRQRELVVAVNIKSLSSRVKAPLKIYPPVPVVRYAYYLAVFLIPFEEMSLGIGMLNINISQWIVLLLIGLAVVQPRTSFRPPPLAFWCFVGYLYVYVMFGYLDDPKFDHGLILHIRIYLPLLFLFWVSYNLLSHQRVAKGALLALGASCISISVLVALGFIGSEDKTGRISVFDGSPAQFADVISLGLLALVGLAFREKLIDKKLSWVIWLGCAVMAVTLVRTGSRGPMLAFGLAVSILLLRTDILKSNLKAIVLVSLTIGAMILASFQIETVRIRWEQTIVEGRTAGRDLVYEKALEMVRERPFRGWGPHNYLYELGARYGAPGKLTKGAHNSYVRILLETGLLGGIIFSSGLWLCWSRAWKARDGVFGNLPMAMVAFILMANMTSSVFHMKLMWFGLAYGLASGYGVASPRLRKVAISPRRRTGHPFPKNKRFAGRSFE